MEKKFNSLMALKLLRDENLVAKPVKSYKTKVQYKVCQVFAVYVS